MDLGATICTPKRPACIVCPLNDNCEALRTTDPEFFPESAPKKEKPVRVGAAFVAISNNGEVFLRSRTESGLLGGMAEVPTTDWTARLDGDTDIGAAPFPASWIPRVTSPMFSRISNCVLKSIRRMGYTNQPSPDGWWVKVENLAGEALPTVMKKAIATAIPDAFAKRRKEE